MIGTEGTALPWMPVGRPRRPQAGLGRMLRSCRRSGTSRRRGPAPEPL